MTFAEGHAPRVVAHAPKLANGHYLIRIELETYNDIVGKWLEETHEVAANIMLAIVIVHIAGVVMASWLHHENLVGAIFSGRKLGTPAEGVRRTWRSVAVLMVVAVLGFWWMQWQSAPSGSGPLDRSATVSVKAADHDRDDD